MFRVNGLHASSVGISSSGFFLKYRIYPAKKLRDSEESAVSHIVGVESYEQIYTVDYAGKSLKMDQIMILSVRYVAHFSCFDRFQGVQIDPLWLAVGFALDNLCL